MASATDYYPFGAEMPGRIFHAESYRFGFNGKENDNDRYGNGNSLDYGARVYDPRIGRWLSVDPLTAKYPSMSPYVGIGDNPIMFVDPDGMKVTAKDVEAFKAILRTLPAEEIARIYIHEDGTICIDGYTKGSTNLQNLRLLVDSKVNHNFITAATYTSADNDKKNVSLPNNSDGRTLFPKEEAIAMGIPLFQASPDDDVQILIRPGKDAMGQGEIAAHEGFGHGCLGEQRRNGEDVNPCHVKDAHSVEQNKDFRRQGWGAKAAARENLLHKDCDDYKEIFDKKVEEYGKYVKKKMLKNRI